MSALRRTQMLCLPFRAMQLHDRQGKRLYLPAEERRAFIAAD